MIDFKSLTNGQLRYVRMVETYYPDLGSEITFKQINEIHGEFLKLRPKYKIGYPNWLLVNNQVRRGVYFFPKEGVDTVETSVTINSEDEEKYNSLLKLFNLI